MANYQIRKVLNDKERIALAKYDNLLSHLLCHRGITDMDIAEKFLNPDYEKDIHDPFLLKDAEKAGKRIIKAIENKEKIAVYADYDADGIPGASIMNDFLTRINYKNFIVYIPHRHNEGFGLNVEAVKELADQEVKLIITIDCGITDVVAVEKANELGVDVIITDHHEPPTPLPPAFAIVDHKQSDCNYPDKNICGSGVAFKLIQAILKLNRFGLKDGHEKWLLDLVGIATLSDMVPLVGENRIFAYYGLSVLRKSPRKGLMQLLRKLKIDQRYLNEDDVAFMITPRINAASRMGLPMDAYNLLTADNDIDAHKYADLLDKINNERKGVVASLVKEVKRTLEERYGDEVPAVIVLGNPEWRPSLLGLVANTCAEEYDRPAFFWGRDGGNVIKGSCRSEGKTSVVELMRASVSETFLQFGGHKHSGGFAVSNEEIHFLEKRLNEGATLLRSQEAGFEGQKSKDDCSKIELEKIVGQIPEIDLHAEFDTSENIIDSEITLDEVDKVLFGEINRLAPFGVGNPKPIFLFRNLQPVSVRKFGKGNDHIEIVFKKKFGEKVSAIAFFGVKEKWANKILEDDYNKTAGKIDLIASIEKSMFRGRPEIRLRVVDVVAEV